MTAVRSAEINSALANKSKSVDELVKKNQVRLAASVATSVAERRRLIARAPARSSGVCRRNRNLSRARRQARRSSESARPRARNDAQSNCFESRLRRGDQLNKLRKWLAWEREGLEELKRLKVACVGARVAALCRRRIQTRIQAEREARHASLLALKAQLELHAGFARACVDAPRPLD